MSGLSRLEEFVEELIEGGFARLLRGRLEPVAIAKRLARAMEDGRVISAGKVFVPNRYRVLLDGRDLEAFDTFRDGLERELAAYLARAAHESGYSFMGRPVVSFEEDEAVARGGIGVHAIVADAESLREGEPTQTLSTQELARENRSAEAQFVLVIGSRQIPVKQSPLSLGRHLDNDVILEDSTVSRQHAQIFKRFGKFLVRDLGSANGTFVNGESVGQRLIRDGDAIRLGDVQLVFRRAEPAEGEQAS